MSNIKQQHTTIAESLQEVYPPYEAGEIAYRVLEMYVGLTKIDIALEPNSTVDEKTVTLVENAVLRLLNNEPLQYVIGEADFYDLVFKVSPAVLIPRPETEELVKLILDQNSISSPSLLEIGTGSGCIPITLKKHLPKAIISACDISDDALAIAKGNAERNEVDVSFFHCDILDSTKWPNQRFDIIVSNPPYVLNSEKELMRPNVLGFEPHLALFVDNDTPLLFYIAIADFALKTLAKNGHLYFEINEAFGVQTSEMLKEKGFSNIVLHQDIFGKERMLSARL